MLVIVREERGGWGEAHEGINRSEFERVGEWWRERRGEGLVVEE